MKELLSENIKELRIVKGINQVEFARALNVTKQCVSNWENDYVVPSVDMLTKIARFFNVSTDYLLGRATDKCIDVTGLTAKQIGCISSVISEFKALNEKD